MPDTYKYYDRHIPIRRAKLEPHLAIFLHYLSYFLCFMSKITPSPDNSLIYLELVGYIDKINPKSFPALCACELNYYLHRDAHDLTKTRKQNYI